MPNKSTLIIVLVVTLVVIGMIWNRNEGFRCSVETQPLCDMIPNCIWGKGPCPNNNCNTICNKYFITEEENIIIDPIFTE